MSNYSDWSRAFQIFDKYESDQEVEADYGVVYAGPDSDDVAADDLIELENLGWRPSRYGHRFYHNVQI